VLDILRGGVDSALLGLGHSSVHDLAPGDLVIPPGFTRTLGAPPGGSPQTRSVNPHLARRLEEPALTSPF